LTGSPDLAIVDPWETTSLVKVPLHDCPERALAELNVLSILTVTWLPAGMALAAASTAEQSNSMVGPRTLRIVMIFSRSFMDETIRGIYLR
jgi:hypothetical protein